MKRFAVLLLALSLCLPSALAAQWEGGRSPAQPYVGVPEVDLEEQIGYMFFYPNPQMSLVGGGRTLYVYLPRDDAQAGDGTLYLATEDGEVWRTAFNDAQSVARRNMTEYELAGLMWGSGVCFEITLPVSLELGRHYFVNLDEGCITAGGGKVANTTVGGTDAWAFDVTGDYGVSQVEYQRPTGETAESQTPGYEGSIATPQPGDRARMDVVLGGEAVCASVYPNDASIQFDVSTITESGELTGTVLTDTPSFGLVFLDAAGNVLLNIEF